MTLKNVTKAAYDPENWFESRQEMYSGEIQQIRVNESGNRNLMRLMEQSLELL